MNTDKLKYYPDNDTDLYYVEFDRGNIKGEFTLFKRQFLYSPDEIEKIEKDKEKIIQEMLNRCHPYNIFTGKYGSDGSIPDKKFICWMIDAMNEKYKKD